MPLETILLILVFIAFFYFMLIRPMRKQVAAQTELRSNLEVGSRVVLTSGMHGTIKHLGEKQAIIELAPGLEVTVVKQAISGIVKPEDEEFEYDDTDTDTDAEADAQVEHTLVDPLGADQDLEQQFYGDRGNDQFGVDQNGADQFGADQNGVDKNKGI